jgi:hypothetical protein
MYSTSTRHFIPHFDESEKNSDLETQRTFLRDGKKGTVRDSIYQYNKEISEAIRRVESGDFNIQNEIEKLSKDW